MALTYPQVQSQIEQLQRRAITLRQDEINGVVDRIKAALDSGFRELNRFRRWPMARRFTVADL